MTNNGKVMTEGFNNIGPVKVNVVDVLLEAVADHFVIPKEMVLLDWLKATCT